MTNPNFYHRSCTISTIFQNRDFASNPHAHVKRASSPCQEASRVSSTLYILPVPLAFDFDDKDAAATAPRSTPQKWSASPCFARWCCIGGIKRQGEPLRDWSVTLPHENRSPKTKARPQDYSGCRSSMCRAGHTSKFGCCCILAAAWLMDSILLLNPLMPQTRRISAHSSDKITKVSLP
jgi:hypothetical protein